jgi:soluble lytic murein transglycosylase-like protein
MRIYFLSLLTALFVLIYPRPSLAEFAYGSSDKDQLMDEAARYEHGEGVARSYAKAMDLYCQAAAAGSVNALNALGWMYANARGVAKDEGAAALIFEMAAQRGSVHAHQLLAYMKPSETSVLPDCLSPKPDIKTTEIDISGELENFSPKGPIVDLVKKLAPTYKIEPQFVLAVISVESGFNVKAVSPKNALGLMQLMPDTATRFGVKNPFNSEDNIRGGMAYLQWLLAYFEGDIALVAAAYNAGERAVERYRGVPPYPETQNYVRKIAKLYNKAIHPFETRISKPSSVLSQMKAIVKR